MLKFLHKLYDSSVNTQESDNSISTLEDVISYDVDNTTSRYDFTITREGDDPVNALKDTVTSNKTYSASSQLLEDLSVSRANRNHLSREFRVETKCQEENSDEEDDNTKRSNTFVDIKTFSKEDWHSSKLYSREIILSIIFIGYDAITSISLSTITVSNWNELKTICAGRKQKIDVMDTLDCMPWNIVKDIINPMRTKYQRDYK